MMQMPSVKISLEVSTVLVSMDTVGMELTVVS